MKKVTPILIILILLFPTISFAHPGRTDSSGCHTCKTNCPDWGLDYSEYHCHNAKAVPQPEEPIKSTYGSNGSGYTTPAPEYKAITPVTSTNKTIEKTTTQTNTPITPSVQTPKTEIYEEIKPVEKIRWYQSLFTWFFGK